MLAANPHLELGLHRATSIHRDLHQFAHSFVQGDEGIVLDDALVGVLAQESAGIVAAQPERGLGQIVGAEGEELGALCRSRRP